MKKIWLRQILLVVAETRNATQRQIKLIFLSDRQELMSTLSQGIWKGVLFQGKCRLPIWQLSKEKIRDGT